MEKYEAQAKKAIGSISLTIALCLTAYGIQVLWNAIDPDLKQLVWNDLMQICPPITCLVVIVISLFVGLAFLFPDQLDQAAAETFGDKNAIAGMSGDEKDE